MEYISVKQAAEKWNISERYVQRYCTEGRIVGAVKFGGAWTIPADAHKPSDRRKNKSSTPAVTPRHRHKKLEHIVMPLINSRYHPGHCLETIEKISDTETRELAYCEYYYFSGLPAKSAKLAQKYLEHEDMGLRLSACWVYAYAHLSLGHIKEVYRALEIVQGTVQMIDEHTPAPLRALAVCIGTAAKSLLHLPMEASDPLLQPVIFQLPEGLRLFALYVQAHRAYLQQAYAASVGIIEAALALEGDRYPLPAIYLHLMAVMDFINLKMPEPARAHLLKAWEIAKKDDFVQPFAEHHGLLCGMLEAVLKKDYPEDFARIIDITYDFSAGWIRIHNAVTDNHVTDALTTTEFSVAMLAAKNWSNKEISSHLGISVNTVKLHISSALQKLGISQRKELVKYMLK